MHPVAFLNGAAPLTMAAQQQRTRLHKAVSLGLPAHMMVVLMEWAGAKGFEFRADVIHNLNNAAAVPLVGLDELSISTCARMMDEAAKKVLDALSPDDPRDGLAAVAMLFLVMIDEGLWADTRNQAVLVALLMLEDMKQPGGEWSYREAPMQHRAKRLLRLLQSEGFYKTRVVEHVVTDSALLTA